MPVPAAMECGEPRDAACTMPTPGRPKPRGVGVAEARTDRSDDDAAGIEQIVDIDARLTEEQRKFAPPERIGVLLAASNILAVATFLLCARALGVRPDTIMAQLASAIDKIDR